MLRPIALYAALPFAWFWVRWQEKAILRAGRPLSPLEADDALRAGVLHPERVRIRVVDEVPPALGPLLRKLLIRIGMVESAGMCLRYGIYLHADFAANRRVLVHELVHTAQYEQLGGIRGFLRQYLQQWLTTGYAGSALELEADRISREVCG